MDRHAVIHAPQLARFRFGPDALRRAQALSDNDYLIRQYLTLLGGRGRVQNIFTHGSAGREFARSQKRVLKRFRPIDVKTFSGRHLAHSEDLTDVLLSFDHLVKPDDRITRTEMLHERYFFE